MKIKKEPREMAMIHKIRERMSVETKGMTGKEIIEYFRGRAKSSSKKLHHTNKLLRKAA